SSRRGICAPATEWSSRVSSSASESAADRALTGPGHGGAVGRGGSRAASAPVSCRTASQISASQLGCGHAAPPGAPGSTVRSSLGYS
ncbi:MAG: hypothetical protein ACK56I_10285, partial [bacterium]